MEEQDKILSELTGSEYKYGFTTDIETEMIPKGLDEEVVRLISAKKGEPEWMLEYRLKAFRHWKTMTMPRWPHLDLPEIDYLLRGSETQTETEQSGRDRSGAEGYFR